jgi:ATP-dependent Clp protease ATP-binding subunit ClpC
VVCFDEVEKAHPEAVNMLLQIMEDGQLSDAKGRKVDFRNTIILMTSNVGADVISKSPFGFRTRRSVSEREEEEYSEMRDKVLDSLKGVFRPEFLNRIDGVMVFHALNQEHIKEIVDLEIQKVCERLSGHGLSLQLAEDAREYLAEEGYDPNLGARPLRRVIQNEVEDSLSEGVLEGRFGEGDTVVAYIRDGEIAFRSAETDEGAGTAEMENGEAPPMLETVLG